MELIWERQVRQGKKQAFSLNISGHTGRIFAIFSPYKSALHADDGSSRGSVSNSRASRCRRLEDVRAIAISLFSLSNFVRVWKLPIVIVLQKPWKWGRLIDTAVFILLSRHMSLPSTLMRKFTPITMAVSVARQKAGCKYKHGTYIM